MGFSSFHNATPNPAQRYYRWSGGLKDVTLPDGSQAKQLKGELVFFDGEKMESQDLPFTFCVLEQTSSVTGFKPGTGSNTRYYSNEVTSFDEPMKVTRRDDNGTEVILEGVYSSIKDKLPEGCKYQTNLYIYNPASQSIERLNLKGSALSAWIEFGQKHKGIYEHTVTLVGAGEKKTMGGTVDFLPPKFELGDKYIDSDMKILTEQDAIVVEYLKGKREANMNGAAETDSNGDASIDQTPKTYDGEQSQEQDKEEDEQNEGLSLSDVPF